MRAVLFKMCGQCKILNILLLCEMPGSHHVLGRLGDGAGLEDEAYLDCYITSTHFSHDPF